MFVLLTLIFSVSLALREEEVWGTSARLSIAPVPPASLLGGKLLARLIVGTAQLLLLLVFGHFVYGLRLGHSPFAMILVATAVVASMTCFAAVVAAFVRTREQAIPVGLAVAFVLASLGGLFWPLYDLPRLMQQIANALITTWSMSAIQDVMLRDKSLSGFQPSCWFSLPTASCPFSSHYGSSATEAKLIRDGVQTLHNTSEPLAGRGKADTYLASPHGRLVLLLALAILSVLLISLVGCSGQRDTWRMRDAQEREALASDMPSASEGMDYDPWESFNDKTFYFNFNVADHYAIKPAAKVWAKTFPEQVRQSLANAFYNLAMPKRFVNKVLQGRVSSAGLELTRFVVNTTVGVAGFFDVASRVGIEKVDADTGETFALYGVVPGLTWYCRCCPQWTCATRSASPLTRSWTRSRGLSLRSVPTSGAPQQAGLTSARKT